MEPASSSAAEIVETVEICAVPYPEQLAQGTKIVYVKKNSKFENLHGFAMKEMKEEATRRIIFRGYGEACEKCISCVEVFKRKYLLGRLYQWNQMGFSKSITVHPATEEHGEKTVEKTLPTVFVLISKDPFPGELQCAESMQTSEDIEVSLFDKVVRSERKRHFDQTRSIKRKTENVNKWRRQMKESKRSFEERKQNSRESAKSSAESAKSK